MASRLSAEQYIAINYLALPKRGGLTMKQIAEECGVTRKTVYNWTDDPTFTAELKKRMVRNTRMSLPEMLKAAEAAVVEDKNASMFKLMLQMNDMLTDPVSVGDKLDASGDIDAMQKRIEEYKKKNKPDV